MAFFPFAPALRIVNSGGSVVSGPLVLSLPNTQGIYLRESRCEYVPELLGPWTNLGYSTRWKLLGYRPRVELDFNLLTAAGASGQALLYQYYVAGLTGENYAALQFNLYSGTSSTWRGMIPTTPWAPRPANGKQRIGYELSITLDARDLVTAPGDFTSGNW